MTKTRGSQTQDMSWTPRSMGSGRALHPFKIYSLYLKDEQPSADKGRGPKTQSSPFYFGNRWSFMSLLLSLWPSNNDLLSIEGLLVNMIRYINQEISPEYSLVGLMLKLKLQYFGHLMRRADSLEKTLIWKRPRAGGEGDDRGWDGWMASPTQWTWVWVNSGSWWWTGRPGVLQSVGLQRVEHDWAAVGTIFGPFPIII